MHRKNDPTTTRTRPQRGRRPRQIARGAALGAALFAVLPTQAQAATYGTSGLKTWIQENIITVVILAMGILVMAAAKGGNLSKGVTIGAGVLMGICVLGLASGTNATDLGNFAIGLFKTG